MAPYPGAPRRGMLRQRPLWLEAAGQRRLRAMHARLQVRRQLLQRWATLVEQVDEQVTERLEGLGGAEDDGYDPSSADITGRAGLWDEEALLAREELEEEEDEEPKPRRSAPARRPAASTAPRTASKSASRSASKSTSRSTSKSTSKSTSSTPRKSPRRS